MSTRRSSRNRKAKRAAEDSVAPSVKAPKLFSDGPPSDKDPEEQAVPEPMPEDLLVPSVPITPPPPAQVYAAAVEDGLISMPPLKAVTKDSVDGPKAHPKFLFEVTRKVHDARRIKLEQCEKVMAGGIARYRDKVSKFSDEELFKHLITALVSKTWQDEWYSQYKSTFEEVKDNDLARIMSNSKIMQEYYTAFEASTDSK